VIALIEIGECVKLCIKTDEYVNVCHCHTIRYDTIRQIICIKKTGRQFNLTHELRN